MGWLKVWKPPIKDLLRDDHPLQDERRPPSLSWPTQAGSTIRIYINHALGFDISRVPRVLEATLGRAVGPFSPIYLSQERGFSRTLCDPAKP